MIVSHQVYIGFVTLMVVGIGVGWSIRDFLFLRRVLREERDPVVRRDKIFGAVMGMGLAVVGLIGAVRYHWGL